MGINFPNDRINTKPDMKDNLERGRVEETDIEYFQLMKNKASAMII